MSYSLVNYEGKVKATGIAKKADAEKLAKSTGYKVVKDKDEAGDSEE